MSQFLQKLYLSAVVICTASSISAAPVPTPDAVPTAATAPMVIPAMPELAASSYVLLDAASGKVLVEHNADERLPPASLTKLMTAYIATKEIKRGQISEKDLVTVSEKAWRTGGSRMFIDVGKQVSVDDLLHGIIIQSGNDASVALAEHIAGSEEAFSSMMNASAVRLSLDNTHFMNATGLPAEEHYSSAHDMAKLARAIIYEDSQHYSIYAQKEFLWNGIKQPNRNLLLWRDKTVDGLKTGHTDEAGYCLVASAVRDDMRLISVVFGASSEAARAAETQKLLTYGFRFFETRAFYKKGVELAESKVWKGESSQVKVGLVDDLILTLPRGQVQKMAATMILDESVVAPVKQGDRLGVVEVRLADEIVHSADLVALHDVVEGGFFNRLLDTIRMFFYNLFN
ncbi:MAG: D-alanyl-D-alanine carboxypeptidase [Pseudomonas sp.]|jgi:D-alanyl-D-alanine carboxypeptidase (penicillin-binding protein 5/6)|nr:D-alanyl-D-alanine carboxypeptidase [Pseudomonas sp.]MDD2222806.1 D-alanyl-D-alanine carboxypeptidase [Pseudomonas sp.]MDY0413923.1 D-alanyl-D-alanine carboxypeptidase family protein [Pseudomonas sp.]NLO55413.1 D-alanyl-D-alanine carboxypeptidase [Gammaproteobacteria bacterium]